MCCNFRSDFFEWLCIRGERGNHRLCPFVAGPNDFNVSANKVRIVDTTAEGGVDSCAGDSRDNKCGMIKMRGDDQ